MGWGCGAAVARPLCISRAAEGLGFEPLLLHFDSFWPGDERNAHM